MNGFPVTNQTACHKNIWENGGIAPCILHCSCRQRWVVKFTSQPLYLWSKSQYQYPLDRNVSGTRSSTDTVKKRKSIPPAVNKTLISWLSSPYISHYKLKCFGWFFFSECVSGHLAEKKHACHKWSTNVKNMCAEFFNQLLEKQKKKMKKYRTENV